MFGVLRCRIGVWKYWQSDAIGLHLGWVSRCFAPYFAFCACLRRVASKGPWARGVITLAGSESGRQRELAKSICPSPHDAALQVGAKNHGFVRGVIERRVSVVGCLDWYHV